MIAPKYTVLVEPTKKLLQRLKAKAADLSPVLEGPVANRVYAMFGQIFASEGSYIGSPWPALAPSTLASKARIGRAGMGILRRYNTLWSSLTKRSHPLGYRIVTPHSLTIGTSVPYARHPQLGEGQPRRPIVPDSAPQQDVKEWELLMLKYVES